MGTRGGKEMEIYGMETEEVDGRICAKGKKECSKEQMLERKDEQWKLLKKGKGTHCLRHSQFRRPPAGLGEKIATEQRKRSRPYYHLAFSWVNKNLNLTLKSNLSF